jgi:hypothetical protein
MKITIEAAAEGADFLARARRHVIVAQPSGDPCSAHGGPCSSSSGVFSMRTLCRFIMGINPIRT